MNFFLIKFQILIFTLAAVASVVLFSPMTLASQKKSTDKKQSIEDEDDTYSTNQKNQFLLVEYEEPLKEIADEVKNILNVRLSKYNIISKTRQISDEPSHISQTPYQWHVTIISVSEKYIIVTVDNSGEEKAQEVRTVEKDTNIKQTAWAVALVSEEIIAMYNKDGDLPALGAGLALIEPDIIAGTKDKPLEIKTKYPQFKAAGLSLSLSGIWSINQIIAGSTVIVKGLFSKHLLAAISLGWEGNAHFSKNNISGTMSLFPINLLLGALFLNQKHLDIAGWSGFSMGFAIFKTSDGHATRTDMTFMPEFHLSLEIVAKISEPWAISVQGGVRVPLVRDILTNHGYEIYNQVWIIPFISIGPQLYF
ncbi:MAG: hypothetical protein JXR91_02945 [Deltaproteobacteria bacterium]|nr:hypothetical protein [Deltaproteobacteria bacterium]